MHEDKLFAETNSRDLFVVRVRYDGESSTSLYIRADAGITLYPTSSLV